MRRLAVVVGTRPNYMKVAPLIPELRKSRLNFFAVDLGQHTSPEMRDSHLTLFKIPIRYKRSAGHLTGLEQFRFMVSDLTAILKKENPYAVLVVGDTNSTLAGSVAASACGVSLIHLESGLRSFDESMPEEHNRVITDSLASLLLLTEPSAERNLVAEKCRGKRVYVGNPMIDTLVWGVKKLTEDRPDLFPLTSDPKKVFVTLHRPALVDHDEPLFEILDVLRYVHRQGAAITVTLHPRLAQKVNLGALRPLNGVLPLPYLDVLREIATSAVVVTDSGGIQEETTALGVPCLTVRENTERPSTCTKGTNYLVGIDGEKLEKHLLDALAHAQVEERGRIKCRIKGWDGHAAPRITQALADFERRVL
jgi:UDP-N-acetylglucosamine 2-epimerase (non-hydrolysing)